MDIRTLVDKMLVNRDFQRVASNPLAQFPRTRRMLGLELLPERNVALNSYDETRIKYRTLVANDGTRYSPVQKKGSTISGAFHVILGHSDIGSEFTSADYDALLKILDAYTRLSGSAQVSMQAVAQLVQWADKTINRPLVEKNELMAWQAINNAQVVRKGDGDYVETVNMSNPSGHRINAAGTWSDNNYDPLQEIFSRMEFLASKGYTVRRIITALPVLFKLLNNAKVKAAAGGYISVGGGGVLSGSTARVSRRALDEYLQENGLPVIETYDLQYATQTATQFFYPRNAMTFIATTDRDETIDLGDTDPLVMSNTLGYTAIGTPAGQSAPGRRLRIEAFDNKPPRIEGEGWQASFPVVTEPEAITVISAIS